MSLSAARRAGTLLKLTVAATFVIELPATALIIAPWRPLRVVGAALQAFLQARRQRAAAGPNRYGVNNASNKSVCALMLSHHQLWAPRRPAPPRAARSPPQAGRPATC